MPVLSKYKWPNKTFFAVMLALSVFDVARGKFPFQPVSFVIGCLLAPLVWPGFHRIKSTAWSRIGLVLFGVTTFVVSVAVGIMLKPFGEQVGRYYFDVWLGFFLGLCLRIPFASPKSQTLPMMAYNRRLNKGKNGDPKSDSVDKG